MRRCFLGRWICLLVSERFRLVWRCRLCDYSTYIPLCLHWHGGQCLWQLVPDYVVVFQLGWVCCQNRYVIGVVGVGNCFWGIPSASFLCQLEAVFSAWTITKGMKKKLDKNYTRILQAVLKKSCRQYHTNRQLYSRLIPITKTIEYRRTTHAGHCWRSKEKLMSDILQWTPSHGRAKVGRPVRTYIHQFCADKWCILEDLPEAMDDIDLWLERFKEIRVSSKTWRWWWWCVKIINVL